jgi:hypothetical protein
MRRIIYTSIAAPDLDRAAMFHLLHQARSANQARGLTGVLLRADRRLLQVLEGPTWKLLAVFESIRRDVRHSNVAVIEERSIAEPTFPGWPMRYFDDRKIGDARAFFEARGEGAVSAEVEEVVRDFFVEAFAASAAQVIPSRPRAVRPSSPRPC